MTERQKTVTDHLLDAQSVLDRDTANVTLEDLQRVLDSIEAALNTIQLLRCEAQTALDRL